MQLRPYFQAYNIIEGIDDRKAEKVDRKINRLMCDLDSKEKPSRSKQRTDFIISEKYASLSRDFMLRKSVYDRLYDYQREGVSFLYSLYSNCSVDSGSGGDCDGCSGGILGDDMGLGKTLQVIAFLAGVMEVDAKKSVLLVAPMSVLPNWDKEIKKWGLQLKVLLHVIYYTTKETLPSPSDKT